METTQSQTWFLCEFCKRAFQSIDKLIIHRKVHLEIVEPSKTYNENLEASESPPQEENVQNPKPKTVRKIRSKLKLKKNSKLKSNQKGSPTSTSVNAAADDDDDEDEGDIYNDGILDSDSGSKSPSININVNLSRDETGASLCGRTGTDADIVIDRNPPNLELSTEKIAAITRGEANDEIQFITKIAHTDEITVLRRGIPSVASPSPLKRRRVSTDSNLVHVTTGEGLNFAAPEIFICAHCPRMCPTKTSLEEHIQHAHHKGKTASEPITLSDSDDENPGHIVRLPIDELQRQQSTASNNSNLKDASKIIVTIDENCRVDFDSAHWKDSELVSNRPR